MRTGWTMLLAVVLAAACGRGDKTEKAPGIRIDAERFVVQLFDDDIALGGEHPLVTIVFFTDYACPPCGRTWQVMDNLIEDYAQDVRVVYRSHTVPGFSRGEQGAEAAFAAEAQGKFWEMHRHLFKHPGALDRPSLRAHATEVGLDVPRFTDELDTGVYAAKRARHRREAKRLGVQGVPALFVNGLYVAGYADEQTWHGLVDEEIKRSKEMLQNGTPRAELFAAIMSTAASKRVPTPQGAKDLRKAAGKSASAVPKAGLVAPSPDKRYRVEPGDGQLRGAADAPVVIVEFMDYQCPYCRKAWTQELEPLVKQSENVALAIRHLPLPMHEAARGAAKATLAAGRQGKLWPMHDKLIAHEGALGREHFVAYAGELGLDSKKFLADLDDPALEKQIDGDTRFANEVGITGTPGFFINGRYINGYSPGQLAGVVKEELDAAQKLLNNGVARRDVFRKHMEAAVPREEFPNR